MALGRAQAGQGFDSPRELLGDRLREGSLYRLLADHGHAMFPDGYFADLYAGSVKGRPTVAARVVATVMVLQAFEGLSDREACDRLEVDLRWQAATGVDTGHRAFHPTVLVGMRNKLRASGRPRRLFEDTKAAARQAGAMKGRARVLDSTAIYDAVATQDTVTQLRSAIRKVLSALDKAGSPVAGQVRQSLTRDDDYAGPGKPPCDWDDPAAREALVDELVRDALAALGALDGRLLPLPAIEAADLLALVAGQDVEEGTDGVFRIARKVTRDRVISTVDTQARHGHKSRNRRFDGYKAHLSVDPDSELIDEVALTPANTPDRDAAGELLDELADGEDKPDVVGDSAYGDAATRADLEAQGFTVTAKCPPARNSRGRYSKDLFTVDLQRGTVTCPAGQVTVITASARGGGKASFRPWCAACPLRPACTSARRGRTIAIHPHEDVLQKARAAQRDPAWQDRYRADRPLVERKISHFTRRAWGGRKARTRGLHRISTDIYTRAGAINWARLAVLGLHHDGTGWTLQPAWTGRPQRQHRTGEEPRPPSPPGNPDSSKASSGHASTGSGRSASPYFSGVLEPASPDQGSSHAARQAYRRGRCPGWRNPLR